MTKFSFTLFAVAILTAAAVATAQAQECQTPQLDGNASCYCGKPDSRFELFASLLYLKPSSSNLEYATLVSPFPIPTPNWANQAIDPEYRPAFNVGMRYIVPGSCNDIQLAWTHFDSTDKRLGHRQPDAVRWAIVRNRPRCQLVPNRERQRAF